ncbi:MAG: type I glutamate--ammonia ligase [Alphaproteobacteria bacterium CG_4_10_14_0_2_um_filter_63_37]|nr:MAG: type I glutamate--ammonia ligase [Proteobacteria bacterium CG1_02_64_396]PJA23703.1 MAG: type I glutamate--ammonia ligase [Alphaproteobacteria bacterium CG_4_10_14_0_2_um_filter_63_37]
MSDAVSKVFDLIKEHDVKFVDFRFTDSRGKWQHISAPIHMLTEDTFVDGLGFDGSSIAGWCDIHNSDMLYIPDAGTAMIDPFFEAPTLVMTCDIRDPYTGEGYEKDPRAIAKRAMAYLQSTGVADTAYFGPESEFFLFDDVRFGADMGHVFFRIDSEEAAWNSAKEYESGNMGHRPGVKGGYFPVPPVDSSHEIRNAMCEVMGQVGLHVEYHHHEVATANQCEIDFRFDTLLQTADNLQWFKYVVHNVAHQFGRTATFMPKPMYGDNGSGMHVHQSLWKDGKPLFAGNGYAGLSELALFYIGGVIKHAKAINAFTNGSTNSYKRLVPHFEAPVLLAYSGRNRSASIRIPASGNPKGRRIEVRFPDSTANPYLAFSVMMMAGLDGILNRIDPGPAMDKNLYDLPAEEQANIPHVATSLTEALNALEADHDFLLQGGVFSKTTIDSYIALKREEEQKVRTVPHPVEYQLYYSV